MVLISNATRVTTVLIAIDTINLFKHVFLSFTCNLFLVTKLHSINSSLLLACRSLAQFALCQGIIE